MQIRLISGLLLLIYSAILMKVMIFKDVPVVKTGAVMLKFGGTQEGEANFVPFKTILPYLLGEKGWLIAGINIVGNIALLVPVGLLLPLILTNMTWKKALAIALAAGLFIEGTQALLRVGIFDIDDVILNGLGVMIGYGTFVMFANWMAAKN